MLAGSELSTRAQVRDALGTLEGVWFADKRPDVIRALQDGATPVAIVVHLDVDGCLSLIQRIRSNATWSRIPLFTLAGSDPIKVVRAIQAGARASLSAPFKGLTRPIAEAAGVSVRSITPARGVRRPESF